MSGFNYYELFHRFIHEYKPRGFIGIDRQDKLIKQIEEFTTSRKQFFYIADILQVKIKFASSGTMEIFGIEPEQLDPSTFYTSTHPAELVRHNLARTKLFKMGQELFISHDEPKIISGQFTMKHMNGTYKPLLVQCYLFYSRIPYETVFILQVTSDLSNFKLPKHGYHYYLGDDLMYFRYPDNEFLKIGNVFSDREFEIIKCIADGLGSSQIANKLYLSIHTVNTHRRNILKKTGKSTTHELIMELKERGVI
jgi:DNA-binding CsgD family transcriptional regulator